ncbi:MAG TPA: hypothetical protein VFU14_02080 [Acidimicrobiales bacterium]|nr:hypothetical protein [Acidimicrobiales bacterium]
MLLDMLLLVLGLSIVAVTLYDLAATTISVSTVRGPLSTRVSEVVWWLSQRTGGTRLSTLQRASGPLLLLLITVGWLLSLTLGWSLVFSMEGALAQSAEPEQQGSSIRWVDSVFFVFGNLIGRGSSELSPDEVVWSSLESAMAVTGVGLLTLSLAWIIPVVAAVVDQRKVAAKLSAMGATPQDIVLRSWNGRDLGDLNLHLLPLIDDLALLAQRHLAYPVIHYFHSSDGRTAIGARIAALDEALTIIEAAGLDDVERGTGLDGSTTRPLRQAVSDYLDTLDVVFISDCDAPRPPSVDRVVAGGVAGADLPERVQDLCGRLTTRRARLHGYVLHDGWCWDDLDSVSSSATAERERSG